MKKETFIQTYGVEPELVAYWIGGVLRQMLRDDELAQLDDWITKNRTNEKLYGDLVWPDRFEKELEDWHYTTGVDTLRAKILRSLVDQRDKRNRVLVITMASVAAAAAVALILFFTLGKGKDEWWKKPVLSPTVFLPGGDQLLLDDTANAITKTALYEYTYEGKVGVLKYNTQRRGDGKPAYHVFSIPEDWKYYVSFEDGSQVCINSESSIRFPQFFSGAKREVEVRGESFFNIKQSVIPFIISVPNGKVILDVGKVYVEHRWDGTTKILVYEGKAKVQASSGEVDLRPDVMARINPKGSMSTFYADTAIFVSQKGGKVRFFSDYTWEDIGDNFRDKLKILRN